MRSRTLRHLDDHQVLDGMIQTYSTIRSRTVEFLRFLAEFDQRKLFRAAGYPSAHEFCMQQMHMSEDQACKHLRAARAGRRFPEVFDMIADGRSNVTAVTILSRRLTQADGGELLRASAGMTNAQVRVMLAERFPEPDVPTVMFALGTRTPSGTTNVRNSSAELAAQPVDAGNVLLRNTPVSADPDPHCEVVGGPAVPVFQYTLVSPLSPASFALQCTLSAAAHAKLREVQDLLAPRIARDDVSSVLERALDLLLDELNRTRKAALKRDVAKSDVDAVQEPQAAADGGRERVRAEGRAGAPHDRAPGTARVVHESSGALRSSAHGSRSARTIPAKVRRRVWARDRGRCQFVSASGHQCKATSHLEIDHRIPVAMGGESTLKNLRLLCRAHNQFEAERRLGAEFMERKRRRP